VKTPGKTGRSGREQKKETSSRGRRRKGKNFKEVPPGEKSKDPIRQKPPNSPKTTRERGGKKMNREKGHKKFTYATKILYSEGEDATQGC